MIKIGTWNVRDTNDEGAIRKLIKTKKKYKIDILNSENPKTNQIVNFPA
jgi:hypothetical protein